MKKGCTSLNRGGRRKKEAAAPTQRLCRCTPTHPPSAPAPSGCPADDLVSTWNPNDWVLATNQTGDVPAGSAKPKMCTGGTATNCFAAACRRGPPTSTALPEGQPAYNATCYCPYFTTEKEPFLMGNGTNPCGPTDASELTKDTIIYNGA